MSARSKLFLVTFLFSISALVTSCSGTNEASSSSSPSPTPTPTEEELKARKAQDAVDQQKAIGDFVTANHKGWALRGVAGGLTETCDESEPCDLHLVKGDENKVITVLVRKFHRQDGSAYWFVYEATKLDLARHKIKTLRESSEEKGREEERQRVQEEADLAEAYSEREDPDPRH